MEQLSKVASRSFAIKEKGETIMKEQALFCDGTSEYVFPPEPDAYATVTLRFRTGRDDVDHVWLVTGDQRYELGKEHSWGAFDYYHVCKELDKGPFRYYFEIQSGEEIRYYNQYGVTEDVLPIYDFIIVPGFSTPDWAKGAVMYQIYTDRFFNGDKSNDVEDREYYYIGDYSAKVRDWDKYPASMGVREFYGGDLQGVKDKLDYLEKLGVEVIYFNPLFVSPSNHKYDIQDYDYIDPHFGKIVEDGGDVLAEGDCSNKNATKYQKRVTDYKNLEASNSFFADLVEEIHSRGMKVILDGVFNHCGSFNKWMDRECIYEGKEGYEAGAYVSADSPYRDFFGFFGEGAWPYNPNYDGWWGHDTLPKLNYEASENLEDYILNIGRKWVSPPYNVDGWRLDVAADLGHSPEYNHEFWKKFRNAVKEANSNAIILAEHYGDPAEWLKGDEWDSVMNYDAFMEPLTWFLTGMEKHSDEYRGDMLNNADNFIKAMAHHMSRMLTPSLQVAMNELSNHDHSRFLTRTNHVTGRVANLGPEAANKNVDIAVMREAVVVQMTWTGAPTLYYGDEAGVCGFTDPDNRRTYPWGHEDKDLIEFHREMIAIHKSYPSLKTGCIRQLYLDYGIIAYGRFQDKEQVIVVVNNRPEWVQLTIPVWQAEVPMKCTLNRLMYTYENGYTTEYEEYNVERGEVVLNMGAKSALVLTRL